MPLGSEKPLLVIVGPTAVGKTELAIRLAQILGTEIISADSRQIYRKMNIGTAKPDKRQLEMVPHHLIDIVEPDEFYSLSLFQEQARQVIDALHQQNKIPLLVGGTGQYIRAVVQGWQPPDLAPDIELRTQLEEIVQRDGVQGLIQELEENDPESAAKIDPRNIRRVIRAVEVVRQTGKPFSAQRQKIRPPYQSIQIGLNRPRADLYARIDQRIHQMVAAGLLEEVRELLNNACPADARSMSAIGYREMVAVIQGRYSMEDAIVLMKRASRNYVRRQVNWFSPGDASIRWFEMQENTLDEIVHFLIHEKGMNLNRGEDYT